MADMVSQNMRRRSNMRVLDQPRLKEVVLRRMNTSAAGEAQTLAALEVRAWPRAVTTAPSMVCASALPTAGRRMQSGETVMQLVADDELWVTVTIWKTNWLIWWGPAGGGAVP